MTNLFPLGWGHYLAGGLLIGVAVAWLFVSTGRVGGMSSVFSSTWSFVSGRAFFQQQRWLQSRAWRLVYALGLILGAAVWWLWRGQGEAMHTGLPAWQLLIGGLLVGYGARRGGGCTSGHGICGMASLQWPSMLAVLVFMVTAMITAHLVPLWAPAVVKGLSPWLSLGAAA
jgi:uncharacterized protein